LDSGKVTGWQKFRARYMKLGTLRAPDNSYPCGAPEDSIMMFHYCWDYKEYRFDTHYNLLSKSEGFTCGRCLAEYKTQAAMPSIVFLRFVESVRIASSSKYKALFWLKVTKLMFWDLEKHLPDDRGGRKSGDVKLELIGAVFSPFMTYVGDKMKE